MKNPLEQYAPEILEHLLLTKDGNDLFLTTTDLPALDSEQAQIFVQWLNQVVATFTGKPTVKKCALAGHAFMVGLFIGRNVNTTKDIERLRS